MGPIVTWSQYHGIPFSMTLVARVERFGRETAMACHLEIQ